MFAYPYSLPLRFFNPTFLFFMIHMGEQKYSKLLLLYQYNLALIDWNLINASFDIMLYT